ncbi:alpha/beta family hydrolase [Agromyces salentinus]|uniref:Alpha/beta hydrolase n=1 Tax=Agromyces salentinus TaxID=269421 RepID=A0ABN2MLB3_9MICO|nr:alpha/beta family hydrolase [Agromyces salentinus]
MSDDAEVRIPLTGPAGEPVGGVDAISALYGRPSGPWATLVIAHGAGTGKEHPFLEGFAAAMQAQGVATLRFDFPYREAGRTFPDRPPVAITAWRAALAEAARLAAAAGAPATAGGTSRPEPIWASGKSFGGRMASMAVAEGMPAAGLAFLGYPLHPPGRPEKVRDEHLPAVEVPMLFMQGRTDPFANPNDQLDDLVARLASGSAASVALEWVDDANHSFEVKGRKRPADEIGASLAASVVAFMHANPA